MKETTQEPAVELLPCPFCGTIPSLKRGGPLGGWLKCSNNQCPVQPESKIYCSDDSIGLAIENWNTRATRPSISNEEAKERAWENTSFERGGYAYTVFSKGFDAGHAAAQHSPSADEVTEIEKELAMLKDDYAHFEKSCWYCADPDIGDPFRCETNPDGHWHHMLDPGDGLLSPCENSWRLESIFQSLEHASVSSPWIPCSERLPDEDATYLVTVELPMGNPVTDKTPRWRLVKQAAWFNGDWWNRSVTEKLRGKVVAYQSQPAPYQPLEEEENG